MTPLIFLISFAAAIPTTNIDHACQGATIGVAVSDQKVAIDTCVRDEIVARDELKQRWGRFSATAKDDCGEPAGVPFSYVELLTCLEMQSGRFDALNAPPFVPEEGESVAPLGDAAINPTSPPPVKQR
jgi:hypothetical protein